MIGALRSDANWAFLKPRRHRLRKRFQARVDAHLRRAEPGSLAGLMPSIPTTRVTAPEHQVPQWLFAFDPAGMATFRALALLASHPEQMVRAQAEAARAEMGEKHLPFLRSCVLESLRLWPTTPILRETREETNWEHGTLPRRPAGDRQGSRATRSTKAASRHAEQLRPQIRIFRLTETLLCCILGRVPV